MFSYVTYENNSLVSKTFFLIKLYSDSEWFIIIFNIRMQKMIINTLNYIDIELVKIWNI